VIFLTSCTTTNPFRNNYQAPAAVDYFVGTKAIELEFAPQAPPNNVYERARFDVQAIIQNKGAYDIINNEAVKIEIISDSASLEDITPQEDSYLKNKGFLQLRGKSYSYPEGERDIFPIARYKAKKIIGDFENNGQEFFVSLCYPYRTYFSDEVCIDTSSGKLDVRKQVCKSKDRSYSRGQGAPIAITAVESQMVPRGAYIEPRFKIHISQKGSGMIYYYNEQDPGSTTCENIDKIMVNKIALKASLGGQELHCEPNPVFFKNGEAEISCSLDNSDILLTAMNYFTNLNVELKYLYQDNFKKKISIKRTDNELFDGLDTSNYSDCAPWEKEQDGACISRCEYESSKQGSSKILYQDGSPRLILGTEQSDNAEWEEEGELVGEDNHKQTFKCIYSYEECIKNKLHCDISKDLCPPGSYCGEPRCVYKKTANHAPRVGIEEGLTGNRILFYCIDSDNNNLLGNICGCKNTAEYVLLNKTSTSCKNENLNYQEVTKIGFSPGLLKTYYGLNMSEIDKEANKAVCLRVTDERGKSQTRKAYFNCNNNENICFR